MEEVYLARVFHRESMPGNLTGVVVCPSPPRPRDCQFVARRLGLPDTCFVWKSSSGNWMHRTFSPYEELTFCTQTLLAGAACLQAGKDCPFETAIGPVTVHRDEGQYWIRQDVDKARRLKDRSVLHRLGLEEQLLWMRAFSRSALAMETSPRTLPFAATRRGNVKWLVQLGVGWRGVGRVVGRGCRGRGWVWVGC